MAKKDKEKIEDTKDVIRSRKSKRDRQYNYQKKKDKEKFEDIKGVIRSRKSKKDRHTMDERKKNKKCLMIPMG